MDNSKRSHIPKQERIDLNKTQGASTPKVVKHMQNVPYASAVGSIMYAVRCTRPDVAFAQNITSRFQQNPGECHWTTVKNILKYLRNTKDMFLVYGGNLEAELRVDCYCNAGFETDIDDMKSLTGYAWDRFNDLLRACPHHGFSELHQLDTFYNALNANDQDSLNSAAGGNFLDKMPRECLRIIEK
ncbi:hypothetical protein Tco_0503815 [Tanacetum coccineum]